MIKLNQDRRFISGGQDRKNVVRCVEPKMQVSKLRPCDMRQIDSDKLQ